MPLRAKKGRPIKVQLSSFSELLGDVSARVEVLPEAGLLGPAPPRTLLPMRPALQLQEMWCWAACARMVVRFFGGDLEQCNIASRFFELNCCPSAESPECDRGCTIEGVDEAFGLAGIEAIRIERAAAFEEVADQINGNPQRPLIAAIQWASGGGHLVVINGCRVFKSKRYLSVNDPLYGSGDIEYSDLVERYGKNNTGRWVHTWLDLSLS